MEAVFSAEILVSASESTWPYKPEDQHRHLRRRENLKTHVSLTPILINVIISLGNNKSSTQT
jgi:hypothetical protein